MITVESDDAAIRVTIPRGELDISQVEAILRPFRFASLVAGSQMSKAEGVQIAEDSKAAWWEKNERRFAPPGRRSECGWWWITSFPKWGFGNASIAGKLCFAVRGWPRNGALLPPPTTQWNCARKGAFPKPHFGNEGELFKHRDRLLAATRVSEDKLVEALNELLESLQLVEAASIPVGIWMQARRVCDGVDLKDTPFPAALLVTKLTLKEPWQIEN